MNKVNLFVATILLAITFGADANNTEDENQISKLSPETSYQIDSKGGNGPFACSPQPQCLDDVSSTWLDLLFQQLLGQSQSQDK